LRCCNARTIAVLEAVIAATVKTVATAPAADGAAAAITARETTSAATTIAARETISAVMTIAARGTTNAVMTIAARGTTNAVTTIAVRETISAATTIAVRETISAATKTAERITRAAMMTGRVTASSEIGPTTAIGAMPEKTAAGVQMTVVASAVTPIMAETGGATPIIVRAVAISIVPAGVQTIAVMAAPTRDVAMQTGEGASTAAETVAM